MLYTRAPASLSLLSAEAGVRSGDLPCRHMEFSAAVAVLLRSPRPSTILQAGLLASERGRNVSACSLARTTQPRHRA